MIAFCPHCQDSIVVNPLYSDDYIHECNSGVAALDQEDVLVLDGSFTNESFEANPGQTQVRSVPFMMPNKIAGTRGAHEGEKVNPFTVRGNNADITRQRKHLEFIRIDVNGQK